ncbi:hypothetical protein [Companilactobacillus bobalius]|uniref:Uncharacterized protein n=2 Tax=Companilactobacillus bobalius TaxID=2801451 RepID=A0A202FF47_9LACO|nr:hypothetical protein [Companilactobacillus bobalius]KRK83217.1 hypothetical protein FC78_GL002026 [Companilactobacillus bobalius DSM 19674]OVE99094.1 hypothetical protein LKACC16343_00206 [Companilactobacillus bobalius]GEO57069.1 hypothetical protein LBO01_01980 [Companilactobacillus paralimentarius]
MRWNENEKQIINEIENTDLEKFVEDNIDIVDSNLSQNFEKQRNVITEMTGSEATGYAMIAPDKNKLSVPDRLVLVRLGPKSLGKRSRIRARNRKLRRIENRKALGRNLLKEELIYRNQN